MLPSELRFQVHAKNAKLVHDQRIELGREANEGGYDTHVEMTFERLDADTTMVWIAGYGWRENPEGLASSCGNCFGWTQRLCCLKGHLEYNINLRRGFF